MTTTAIQPSITFLNSTGDITISWEKDKETEMLALIEKKMQAGYTFFILKPRLGGLLGNAKQPAENIEQVRQSGSVVVPDALAKAMLKLGDDDVSQAVAAGNAQLLPVERPKEMEVQRAATPEEVVQNQSIAMRPIVAG